MNIEANIKQTIETQFKSDEKIIILNHNEISHVDETIFFLAIYAFF